MKALEDALVQSVSPYANHEVSDRVLCKKDTHEVTMGISKQDHAVRMHESRHDPMKFK